MRPRSLVWLFLVILVGCGVPIEAEPELLSIEMDDPPDIPSPPVEDLATVGMYLVRGDTLVQVTRDLPSPVSVEDVLVSLFDGVTDPEARADLRTSIPAGTQILDVEGDESTLHVDVGRGFAAVGGEREIRAVAQIVLTATAFDGVDRVAFELEGVPTAVPVSDGALADQPVSASDYADLVDS